MFALALISLLWFPTAIAWHLVMRIPNVKSFHGVVNNSVDVLDNESLTKSDLASLTAKYGVLRVNFSKLGDDYVYACSADEFEWPPLMSHVQCWLGVASLITKMNDSDVTESDITEEMFQHLGPSQNFFNKSFDFRWLNLDKNCEKYEHYHIKLTDLNEVEHIVDVKTNTMVSGDVEKYGITLAAPTNHWELCEFHTLS